MSGSDTVIATHGLRKAYGSLRAVDGIDLDVRAGDVYGFLGANGSGKTTTVRMLLGLVLPTAGTVEVLGRPIPKAAREVLPQVGALIEHPAAYGHLSAAANLSLFDAAGPGGARRTRKARIAEVLEQVGLGGVGKRPVRGFSLGMRQRLGLAGALLRRPALLVLDEPTNGLDPQGIHEIRTLLLDLNSTGTTVFLSSHLLAEIEQTCSHVVVMAKGQKVAEGTVEEIIGTGGAVLLVVQGDPARAEQVLTGLGAAVERADEGLVVDLGGVSRARAVAALVEAGVEVDQITPRRRLEDAFLSLVGES